VEICHHHHHCLHLDLQECGWSCGEVETNEDCLHLQHLQYRQGLFLWRHFVVIVVVVAVFIWTFKNVVGVARRWRSTKIVFIFNIFDTDCPVASSGASCDLGAFGPGFLSWLQFSCLLSLFSKVPFTMSHNRFIWRKCIFCHNEGDTGIFGKTFQVVAFLCRPDMSVCHHFIVHNATPTSQCGQCIFFLIVVHVALIRSAEQNGPFHFEGSLWSTFGWEGQHVNYFVKFICTTSTFVASPM